MVRDLDRHLLGRGVVAVVAGEHVAAARVLVVHAQEPEARRPRVERQEPHVVAVEAELSPCGGCGLVVQVEGGRAAQDRVAPADEHVGGVAGGDVDGVLEVVWDALDADRAEAAFV